MAVKRQAVEEEAYRGWCWWCGEAMLPYMWSVESRLEMKKSVGWQTMVEGRMKRIKAEVRRQMRFHLRLCTERWDWDRLRGVPRRAPK